MIKKDQTDLIQELLKSVEILGVDATTNALKIARSNTLTLQDKRVEFVLKMVSEYYLKSIEDIINSHSKSTKRIFVSTEKLFAPISKDSNCRLLYKSGTYQISPERLHCKPFVVILN
jgi:hypothetical protein